MNDWLGEGDVHPLMFEFELMLMQVVSSKNCPYSGETVKGLPLKELLALKDRVDFLDAMELAYKLDVQQNNENQKPRGG